MCVCLFVCFDFVFFFFQAEDGIRDWSVTGVQTCALPILNVNADDAAAGIARALGASRLIFLTDVPGVLDASGGMVRDLPVDAIDGMIDSGVIAGGMAAKVRAIGELAMGFDGVSSCDVLIAGWADMEPAARGDVGVGTRVRWDAAREEQAG